MCVCYTCLFCIHTLLFWTKWLSLGMLIACSLHVVGKLTLAILLRVTNNESGQQFLAVLYI